MQSPLSTALVAALLQIFGNTARADVLQAFFYTSIVLNLGATTCAVLCLIILSDFTTKARVIALNDKNSLPRTFLSKGRINFGYLVEDTEREVLRGFGLGRSWSVAKAVMIHCFLLGTICTFSGMGIWVWRQCDSPVTIFVTIVLGVVSGASGYVLLLLMKGE